MPKKQLRRKPKPLPAWHLDDSAAMLDALADLSEQGWRGSIARDPANDMWRLELNTDTPARQVAAQTGDWLVLDGDLRKVTDVTADYDEVQ